MHVFLTFSFSSKPYTNKPVLLFGDWTYDHQLNYFAARKPYGFEQKSVNRENTCIEDADAVVVLFPKDAAYMQQKYSNKNIYYLGNVIKFTKGDEVQNLWENCDIWITDNEKIIATFQPPVLQKCILDPLWKERKLTIKTTL